jgi:proteic killer suppression protein
VAIQSFANAMVQEFYRNGRVTKGAGWSGISKIALRKLDLLDYAHEVNDLRSPPGNRLEALKGDLKGYYSVRINDRWRVIFRWNQAGPTDVDIVDYH